jgi:hypothetical protein
MNIHLAVDVFLKNTEEIKVNKTSIINGGLIEEHEDGTELIVQKLYYFDVKELEPTGYKFSPDILETIIEEVNLFQGIDGNNYEGVIQSFSKQDLKEKLSKIITDEYDKMLDAIEIAEDSDDEYGSVEGFVSSDYNFRLIIVFIFMFVFGVWYGYALSNNKNMKGAGASADVADVANVADVADVANVADVADVNVVDSVLPFPEVGV